MKPVQLDIAVRTDPGRERTGNEDSFLVAASNGAGVSLPSGGTVEVAGSGWVALAVCDGMGGAAAGEVASRLAVETLSGTLLAGGAAASRDDLGRRLVAGVEEASRAIHAAAQADRARHGMGTTATVCALRGDVLFIAQVGDSRAYLLREGRLTQLTRDQTLATLLIERGQLRPEDLDSFDLGHVILQAVGTAPSVEVDLVELQVARGDVLLVCSDGLSGPVRDEAIRAVLAEASSPGEAVEALVARANEAGGPDNVTCIVARLGGDGLAPPAHDAAPAKACLAPEGPPAAVEDVVDVEAETPPRAWLARLAALVGLGPA